MNFGLFEPLFGKQIPKQHNFNPKEPEPTPPTPTVRSSPAPKRPRTDKINSETPALFSPNQLGELFGELDQSKVIILVLAVAVAIMFVFYFYLNTRQKSQKQLIYKMQKQLKRLRG